ncbi:MAG: histidinol-phosphatase [Rhodobacteraceae bacterium]|nr:histidinol-phosphatase [Paracoccaceae bacterium]
MTSNQKLQNELIEVAGALADAARAEILPHFRTLGLRAENKLDDGAYDPVTIADRAAEQAMLEILKTERPDDAVLGEEFGFRKGTSGLTWVLDPIDGTRGFISGTPTWGVLIAVGGEDGPELGLIDQPYIGERFLGGFGQAWMLGPQGRRDLYAKGVGDLTRASLFTTFPEVGDDAERAAFEALSRQVRLTRFGMDCYAYALLAAGHVDLVVEAGLNAYDIQAPIALIKAAGGLVTNWQGEPAHEGGRVLAAANKNLHKAALAVLSEAD